MNASDLIKQVQEDASEWLEMMENPDLFVAGILANKLIALTSYVEYLEKRLELHASSRNFK
jgi:hypothetical protein